MTGTKFDELFSIVDVDKFVERNPDVPNFTIYDVILILLYADRNNPLVGKIKQMKEIFLTLIELQALKAERVKFKFHKFGPYSDQVEDAIDQLLFSNYISAVGTRKDDNFGIKITDKGAHYIKETFGKLPESTQSLLTHKREQWDTLTASGVINYVYTHYPKYLAESVFKKRYAPIDWENTEAVD